MLHSSFTIRPSCSPRASCVLVKNKICKSQGFAQCNCCVSRQSKRGRDANRKGKATRESRPHAESWDEVPIDLALNLTAISNQARPGQDV